MAVIGAEFDQSKFDTEAEWRSVREQAEQDFVDRLNTITDTGYRGIQSIIQKKMGDAAASTAGAMKSILGTMGASNKKAFQLNKAWALSDATISTFQGVAKGVSLGYPAAIPAVAAALATGLAQVQNIRSQSFGGGGGGAPAASQTASAQASGGGGQSQRATPTQTLRVEGISPESLFSGSVVRQLSQELLDFQKDGGEVVFGQ